MTAKHYLLIALLIALAFGVGYCNRKKEEPAKVRTPAETVRKGVVNTDSLYRVAFKAGEAKGAARYRLLQRDSAVAASKDKRATEKAQHSANTYAKNKNLANCDTALTDCQEEVKAKVAVIATRDKMLKASDSTSQRRLAEVNRRGFVSDSLSNGWQKANAENVVLTRKVKRRNKLLKIGGGIIAVLAGVIAVK